MRTCKYCNVELSDNEINCPLCGAHTTVVNSTPVMTPGEYPDFTKKRSPRILVRNIFAAISFVILMALGITTWLTSNLAFIIIPLAALAYIWLGILQYIFWPKIVEDTLHGIFFYIILSVNLICAYFFFAKGLNGVDNHINALNVSLGIITPIFMAVLNFTFALMIMISGKWHKYAYKTTRLAVIEVLWFAIMWFCGFNIVASIVCASFGFVTIVVGLIFGRETLAIELKKHFFL